MTGSVRKPTANEIRRLKDEAAEAAARGRLDRAAELYREAADGDPRDVGAHQKLAEVLRRAGRIPEAIQAYRAVADRFARDGLLIKAIAISKAILELDPRHVETQATLAELYARRAAAEGTRPPPRTIALQAMSAGAAPTAAPSVAQGPVGIPLGQPTEPETPRAAPPPAPAQTTGFQLVVLAAEAGVADGADEDLLAAPVGPAPETPALPRVPIFSDLSREAFLALAEGMVLHRVRGGEAVIREGDDGTSFYVVASGRFAVSRRDEAGAPVALALLGEGDFFGEMALLAGTRRSATVAAEGDGEVLELPADVLLRTARRHPHVARSLRRFYRQRLLANALAASPVFRPFQRGERKALMERFLAREVAEGDVVVREGAPSDGLYVVLEGAVDVVKRKGAEDVVVGHLREGDLFGEMSCLRKAPASARVVVRRRGTLLRLPRRDFDELVVTHPQILELVATLSEERAEHLDAILTGHAQWTDEGLVLI
jgi:CRP-like cAMP-binding protein